LRVKRSNHGFLDEIATRLSGASQGLAMTRWTGGSFF
jgi:hypothetical protein